MVQSLTVQFSVGAFCVLLACVPGFSADGRGQPIEFSKPHTELVTTNLQETTSKKLEETLLRQRMRPDGPRRVEVLNSDGGFTIQRPLPPPAVTSPGQQRRFREYMDRRRNWVYLSAEELGMGWETEEKLGLSKLDPGATQKEKGSVFERFYQRLKQESEARGQILPELMSEQEAFGFESKPQTESPFARKVDETEQKLHRLFQSQPAGDILSAPERNNVFSIVPDQPWTAGGFNRADSDRKARMDEFKRLLEPSPAVSPAPAQIQTPGVSSLGDRAKVGAGLPPITTRTTPTVPGATIGSGTANPYTTTPIQTPGLSTFNQPLNTMPPAREPTTVPRLPTGPPQRKF